MVNFLKFSTSESDEMEYAKSADPDLTAPDGAVWSGSTLFTILHVLSILRNNYTKSII